ncbi:MAG TPA: AEC family transporter [Leptospiraceae bacterium]|nr:AEC family transporter [Leptospiraceae bacterium]HMX35587.1 AEC family transporter [Leptospiraceae bacterium]HMY34459.1 AEC family transporter [Leptospiraceae bacterium]HMZ67590.1 AEC family transporter [Leptospiraceae bacterium]HNA10474.1 AEC family transporter [Leptospiraceae bacterium]
MQNIIILVICFFMGYFLRLRNRISRESYSVINQFILHISLPAQILIFINGITITKELLLPAGMAWILFLFVLSILYLFKKFFHLKNTAFACLLLTAGLGNTSFLGIPMIETFFGKEFIWIGILCDQPGTFLILSLVAIPIAFYQVNIGSDRKLVINATLSSRARL